MKTKKTYNAVILSKTKLFEKALQEIFNGEALYETINGTIIDFSEEFKMIQMEKARIQHIFERMKNENQK